MPNSNNEPVHEYRLGRILGLVWLNEDENGRSWHNVQIFRLYKEGDTWKRSTSFGRDDVPLLIKVADALHTWIHQVWQDKGDTGEGQASSSKASAAA